MNPPSPRPPRVATSAPLVAPLATWRAHLERELEEVTTQPHHRYLDLVEQTFVILRLPSFSTNPRQEIAKSQGVFFGDTGIRNTLLNAFSTDEFRPDIGARWENWAMSGPPDAARAGPFAMPMAWRWSRWFRTTRSRQRS